MAWITYLMFKLCFISLVAVFAQGLENHTASVCTSDYNQQHPDRSLRLSCPRGGLIYIVQAIHGQSSSHTCAFTASDTCLSNSLYWGPVVACLGSGQCVIPAGVKVLSSCGGVSDYLQVVYQCMASDSRTSSRRFDICGSHPAPGGGALSGVPLVEEGHIMTTNFPAPYPSQALCDCLITAATPTHTRIELELLDFHLEASPDCRYDFVELVRGDDGFGSQDRNGKVTVPAEERLCGGKPRWMRRTVNSTWARLRLRTNEGREFRGFWIRVWALKHDNTQVPVTVTCQSHLAPVQPDPPPGAHDPNHAAPPTHTPPGGDVTNDARVWYGTLPPGGVTGQVSGKVDSTQPPISKNTAIIIGVCLAGVVTMVIINIVGIIICRRNVQANRTKREQAEAARQAANSLDSFSSLDTEYVSLNANGAATYHTHHLPTLYDTASPLYSPLPGTSPTKGSPNNALPEADPGVSGARPIVERTPGVGQSSVTPSSYDYGMLPATYTRKSHTIAGAHVPDEDEDPYAVLRDHMRVPSSTITGGGGGPPPPPKRSCSSASSDDNNVLYSSFRRHNPHHNNNNNNTKGASGRHTPITDLQGPQGPKWHTTVAGRRTPAYGDYEEIDEYPMAGMDEVDPVDRDLIIDQVLRRSGRGSATRQQGPISSISHRASERSTATSTGQYDPAERSQGSGSSGGRPSCSSMEDADREALDEHFQKVGHHDLIKSSYHGGDDGEQLSIGQRCSSFRAGQCGVGKGDAGEYAGSEASTTHSEYSEYL